jgi:hypothetical protein
MQKYEEMGNFTEKDIHFFYRLKFLSQRQLAIKHGFRIKVIRACLELRLRNRTFKSKRAFRQNLHFKLLLKVIFDCFYFLSFWDP